MFLAFQLLHILHQLHQLGLTVGEVGLHRVKVQPSRLLLLHHSLAATTSAPPPPTPPSPLALEAEVVRRQVEGVMRGEGGQVEGSLGRAVALWSSGHLSNLDYLLYLNYLAGRRLGRPNHHPVVPWVTDFSSPGAVRDLTRSTTSHLHLPSPGPPPPPLLTSSATAHLHLSSPGPSSG